MQRFTLQGGACTLSKYTAELTGLKVGDRVSFHQDEENPEDWYMSRSKDGFELRVDKDDTGRLKFNSSVFCRMLLDSQNIEDQSCAFHIGNESTKLKNVEYWSIITLKPIIRKRKKK